MRVGGGVEGKRERTENLIQTPCRAPTLVQGLISQPEIMT